MKHLKTFEASNTPTKDELLLKYIMEFPSEEHFDNWVLEVNDTDDMDEVVWENIPHYDLPELFGLPTYDNDIGSMFVDIVTDVDLDDPSLNGIRSGEITIEEWREMNKYNL